MDDGEIEETLLAKASEHPEEGFWMAYHRLRAEGRPMEP